MTKKKSAHPRAPAHGESHAETRDAREADEKLRALFHKCGAVLMPDRTARAGASQRRQAYRVLFTFDSNEAADDAIALARQVGFEPGETFRDGVRVVVPIEGGFAVAWFLSPPGGAIPPRPAR